jgi:hypothetical protein
MAGTLIIALLFIFPKSRRQLRKTTTSARRGFPSLLFASPVTRYCTRFAPGSDQCSSALPCYNPASQTLGMVTPDPPPNSLGLDLVHPEAVLDSQSIPTSVSTSVSTPSVQPTTSPSTNATATSTADTTIPTTGTIKVDDATKPTVLKKGQYVNPDRVSTGGLPRVKLISLSIHIRTFDLFSHSRTS